MKTTALGSAARVLFTLPALLVLILMAADCGKKKIENPYEPATLTQAVSGESMNKLFKFELTAPQILAVESKLALLTEGDRLEFLVGDDLSLLNSLDPGFTLGVRREWSSSPEVYLVLEHVVEGTDTSFVTADEAPVFPSFQNLAAFNRSAYLDLASEFAGMAERDQTALLKSIGSQGTKIWMSGTLTQEDNQGQQRYFIKSPVGKFIVEGVNPSAEVFLKAVMETGGRTDIAGPLGQVNRPREAADTGIVGPVTLEYFRFQNYLISNG